MSADRYICCDERRRAALLAAVPPPELSGIDYIEVTAGDPTSNPTFIEIVLVKPLPLPLAALTGANFAISGGVRFAAPKVDPVVEMIPAAGPVERYKLTIPGNQPTDFSAYRLAIVTSPTNPAPPAFIDARLSAVDFSFKIACPSDFDCAPCDEETDAPAPEPLFDYRVRDYPGFRRQLLDRMTELVPGFREDDPADLTTTLVEVAAYVADQKSYRLDWVGTEAFLQTARSRASIARHARLLDYAIGEGANARVFAQFDFQSGTDGMVMAQRTPLLVRVDGKLPVIPAADYRTVLAANPIVFETAAPLALWKWRSHIAFHVWGDDECMLPRGATAATLVDGSGGGAAALAPGDFLVLVETASPETAEAADARPDHRHVVRLTRITSGVVDLLESPPKPLVTVEWGQEDALPFDLVIQARKPNVIAVASTTICAEARGNVMLADHGASYPPATALGLPAADVAALTPRLDPETPKEDEAWRPVLDRADVARIAALDLAAAPLQSAQALAAVDPQQAEAALLLDDDFGPWTARRDLLRSGRFDRDFVVETGIDGRPFVRFGDGVNGAAPAPESVMTALGRFGSGLAGNIGTAALGHIVLPLAQQGARIAVTNPLPARGGAAPEPVSAIRIAAPQAFRTQRRAVTEADYAAAAMAYPDVANALAIARWTGAWQTMLVYLDRKEGRPVDAAFARGLGRHIESYRLMGFDVALRPAKPAPLDVQLLVCAKAGAIRSAVAAHVREALRPGGVPGGERGFFHPDNFSFGTPLYASRLIETVMAVDGVQSVQLKRFHRFGRLPQGEIALGLIRPRELEVLRLDDDPSFPENGRLSLIMGGGR